MPLTHETMVEARREGRTDEALRLALTFLTQSASDHYAWYTAASLCVEIGASGVGLAGLRAVGEAFAESGNLPMALVCEREIVASGGDASDLSGLVSVLYGKGSARLRDRLLPPPPLPARVDEEKLGNLRTERSFLVAEADRLMSAAGEAALLAREMGGKGSALPFFPMFSSLGAEGFLGLIDAFSLRRFSDGDRLMEQGRASDEVLLLARGEVAIIVETSAHETREVAVLGPGALVGEMGMVARTPRSATVRARTDGIALVAPIGEIEAIADANPEVAKVIVKFCEIRLLENLMSVSPVLGDLEPAQRTRAVASFDRMFLDAGETAISEGDEGKGIFLVVSGEMSVIRMPQGRGDETTLLTTLKAGDVFGEISTVMKKPATATVRAVTGTALLFLPRDRFAAFTRAFPAVFQRIYEISSQREEEIARIGAAKATPADDLLE
jgi:CRP-like cAMP-binding protein